MNGSNGSFRTLHSFVGAIVLSPHAITWLVGADIGWNPVTNHNFDLELMYPAPRCPTGELEIIAPSWIILVSRSYEERIDISGIIGYDSRYRQSRGRSLCASGSRRGDGSGPGKSASSSVGLGLSASGKRDRRKRRSEKAVKSLKIHNPAKWRDFAGKDSNDLRPAMRNRSFR
jgi:hypothetical protein